jgi:hypothetical protein
MVCPWQFRVGPAQVKPLLAFATEQLDQEQEDIEDVQEDAGCAPDLFVWRKRLKSMIVNPPKITSPATA